MTTSPIITTNVLIGLLAIGLTLTAQTQAEPATTATQKTAPAAGNEKGEPTLKPSEFDGKSFEQCEQILGKPVRTEGPTESDICHYRYYKPNSPNVTELLLCRGTVGIKGPLSDTVNYFRYYFPKGKHKTLEEALASIGVQNPKQYPRVFWETAERSLSKPAKYQHPDADTLNLWTSPLKKDAGSAGDKTSAGGLLELKAMTPATPAVLAAGKKAVFVIKYTNAGPDPVHIVARPMKGGQRLSGFTGYAHQKLPPGSGETEASFFFEHAAVVDAIDIDMMMMERYPPQALKTLSIPVKLTWTETAAAPK